MHQLNTMIKEKDILQKQLEYNQKVLFNESINHRKFESVYNKCKEMLAQDISVMPAQSRLDLTPSKQIQPYKKSAKLESSKMNSNFEFKQNRSKMTTDEFSEIEVLQDDFGTHNENLDDLDDNERIQLMIKREQEKNNKLLNELQGLIS